MKLCNAPFNDDEHPKLANIFDSWGFPLSNFQKWAIYGMLNNKHVLITAHTGSGKTLPAEAAIRHFTSKHKKVIYTGPIKALINQKLYEFTHKFPDISFGIITGDNKDNPEADVLLMTAEILRNTLFKKKMLELGDDKEDANTSQSLLSFDLDIEKELGCVIIDEAHYINDRDRGKVWEETIMLLPKDIQLLLLSATLNKPETSLIPLIESRGGPEVLLCSTEKRVVPLTHYAYLTIPQSAIKNMSGNNRDRFAPLFDKLLLLKGPTTGEKFQEVQYDKIRKVGDFLENNRIRVNKYFVLNQIVNLLKTQNLLPAIMFIFSRRQVDILANKIQLMLHDNGSSMPSTVDKACEKLLRSKLSNWQEYTALPEYETIIKLLRKGIAVHHAGILKEFREMIELLFDSGYIKLLLATETFAVGMNMPTKAAIFTSLEKYDGQGFRFLHPSEYTQMAGRAGRRGIDDKGVVIHLNNLFSRNEIPTKIYRHILTGPPKSVESNFTIHPNLILQLISSGNVNFTKFIAGSMISRDIQQNKEEVQKELDHIEKRITNIKREYRTEITILQRLHDLSKTMLFAKPKKRKAFQREYDNLLGNNKFVKPEYEQYCKDLMLAEQRNKLLREVGNIETWVERTCQSQIDMLIKENFIEDVRTLTNKGKYATFLQEIFSLPIAELLDSRWINELSPAEIASVLSCFTNMKLADEQSVLSVESIAAPLKVKTAVRQIVNKYDKYSDILISLQIANVEQTDLHFNLCELVLKWCSCNDEDSCKKVINECKIYDIGLGDFVKAILKINNIVNEIINVATLIGDLDLLSKLKQIPDLTLKYCITNQSLYL